MNGVLVLDRDMVYGDRERLRRAIADHTESDEAAAELVTEIIVARAVGAIAYVSLLPEHVVTGGFRRVWKLRVRHETLVA
jgi:hypothetical protein